MSNSHPIRILIVNGKMICGGIESFVMNIYRRIDRSKIQFDFLVHYTERFFYDDEIEKLGGKIYRLSFREDNRFFQYKKDLNLFFKEHHYDVVWGHMEALGGFYFRVAKKYRVQNLIAHAHITSAEQGLKGIIKKILKKRVKKYTTLNLACSTEAGKYLYGKEHFELCPNAIETSMFRYQPDIRMRIRKQYDLDHKIVIGCVGRFAPQKNHKFMIDIFKKISSLEENACLFLCGSGDLLESIQKYVQKNQLEEKVIFAGNLGNMNEIYQAFDCLLMPSLYEGLPVSGVEALCSGLKCFFADTITREVAIVKENAHFLSLKQSDEEWARQILTKLKLYQRTDYSDVVVQSGYDINDLTERITKLMIRLGSI